MLEEKVVALALWGTSGILWLLVAMSFVSLAIAVERGVVLALATRGSARIEHAVAHFAKQGDSALLISSIGNVESTMARVLRVTLAALVHGPATVDEELSSALILERSRLERGIAVIGTTGSSAPFIGLLGTVLGIVRAFHELAINPNAGSASVMTGISEALVATAVGLVVAIPAVVLYNLLQRWVKATLSRAQASAHRVSGRGRSVLDDLWASGRPQLVR